MTRKKAIKSPLSSRCISISAAINLARLLSLIGNQYIKKLDVKIDRKTHAGENIHYLKRLGIGNVIKNYTYISMKFCSFFSCMRLLMRTDKE